MSSYKRIISPYSTKIVYRSLCLSAIGQVTHVGWLKLRNHDAGKSWSGWFSRTWRCKPSGCHMTFTIDAAWKRVHVQCESVYSRGLKVITHAVWNWSLVHCKSDYWMCIKMITDECESDYWDMSMRATIDAVWNWLVMQCGGSYWCSVKLITNLVWK